MPLRIVADRGVIAASEAFAALGEVTTLPTAELTPAAVRDADLLIVRSTIKVDRALLDGSRVRFVATATIGVDHLDLPYLESNGIAWASAPGCNADSVVQWFAAALTTLARHRGRALDGLQVGIVGVGNVGGRIARLCRAAGLPPPLLDDPPRARAEGAAGFTSLDALLAASDVVTLHVPLVRSGPDATVRLVDDARLRLLRADAWLCNASRGEVVDGAALLDALGAGRLGAAALDVWEREPTPAPALVAACAVATAHIAGHSLEGKYNGTQMAYDAACAFLGVTPTWRPKLPATPPLTIVPGDRSDTALVLEAVAAGYAIDDDTAALRHIVAGPPENHAKDFRAFRQNYPERREISHTPVVCSKPPAGFAAMGVRLC